MSNLTVIKEIVVINIPFDNATKFTNALNELIEEHKNDKEYLKNVLAAVKEKIKNHIKTRKSKSIYSRFADAFDFKSILAQTLFSTGLFCYRDSDKLKTQDNNIGKTLLTFASVTFLTTSLVDVCSHIFFGFLNDCAAVDCEKNVTDAITKLEK